MLIFLISFSNNQLTDDNHTQTGCTDMSKSDFYFENSLNRGTLSKHLNTLLRSDAVFSWTFYFDINVDLRDFIALF